MKSSDWAIHTERYRIHGNISFRLQTLTRLCLIFISHFFCSSKVFPSARSQTTPRAESCSFFLFFRIIHSSSSHAFFEFVGWWSNRANRHITTHCLSSYFRPIESIMLFVFAYTTPRLRHVVHVCWRHNTRDHKNTFISSPQFRNIHCTIH